MLMKHCENHGYWNPDFHESCPNCDTPPMPGDPGSVASERDKEWILAIGHAVGLDSGYTIPIVPAVEPFKRLFAEIRGRDRTAATQPLTAASKPAPSNEGVGQEDAASAAATPGEQVALPEEPAILKLCDWCNWPLDPAGKMCRPDDCSMRPKPIAPPYFTLRRYARKLRAAATSRIAELERKLADAQERAISAARGQQNKQETTMSETTEKAVTREYAYPKHRYQHRALDIADLTIRLSNKSVCFTGGVEQRGCEQAHGKALEHLASYSDTIFTLECKLVVAQEALSKAEAELTGVRANAARWLMLCELWSASTILELKQDDDGKWSITQIEDVEGIGFKPLRGDTPDDAIDIVMLAASEKKKS